MAASNAWITTTLHFANWFGSLQDGLVVAPPVGFGQPDSVAQAQQGLNNPPAVFPPWGPAGSVFVCLRAGMTSTSGATAAAASNDNAPNGFRGAISVTLDGAAGDEIKRLWQAPRQAEARAPR